MEEILKEGYVFCLGLTIMFFMVKFLLTEEIASGIWCILSCMVFYYITNN